MMGCSGCNDTGGASSPGCPRNADPAALPFRRQRRLAGSPGDGANLARWAACIGPGEQVVTTKTLRRRFFSIAGRLTCSARRLTLHLPERRPWAEKFSRALARLQAIPLRTGSSDQDLAGQPRSKHPHHFGIGPYQRQDTRPCGCLALLETTAGKDVNRPITSRDSFHGPGITEYDTLRRDCTPGPLTEYHDHCVASHESTLAPRQQTAVFGRPYRPAGDRVLPAAVGTLLSRSPGVGRNEPRARRVSGRAQH